MRHEGVPRSTHPSPEPRAEVSMDRGLALLAVCVLALVTALALVPALTDAAG
jgi:hypothetical protein